MKSLEVLTGVGVESREALLHFAIMSCAFGFALTWLMYGFDASNEMFGFDALLSEGFKQASWFAIAVALFLYPLIVKRSVSGRFWVVAVALFSIVSVGLLTAARAYEALIPVALLASGSLWGLSFAVPLARWISYGIGRNFTQLFFSVSFGALVTGVLSCALCLLPDLLALCLVAGMPICSALLFGWLSLRRNDVELPKELDRPHTSRLYFLSMLLSGAFAWSLFVNNWMPIVELSWLWFFIPCGIGSCAIVVASAMRRIAFEIVYSLLIGVSCIVSLLALITPLLQNAVFYSAMFMSAWFLLLFALAGSVWCGSAYRDSALKTACMSVALICLSQFFISLVVQHFARYDLTLLVVAVALLALSLVILLIVKVRELSLREQERRSAAFVEESEGLGGIVETYSLTEREGDVLRLLAKGNSVKGIAEKLVVSENTVKFHRRNIYQKLGINSRQSLIDMIEGSDEGR